MFATSKMPRVLLLCGLTIGAFSALAQNEIRSTFFKEADAAKAAADALEAEWLAPRSYQRGMKEYRDAEGGIYRIVQRRAKKTNP